MGRFTLVTVQWVVDSGIKHCERQIKSVLVCIYVNLVLSPTIEKMTIFFYSCSNKNNPLLKIKILFSLLYSLYLILLFPFYAQIKFHKFPCCPRKESSSVERRKYELEYITPGYPILHRNEIFNFVCHLIKRNS